MKSAPMVDIPPQVDQDSVNICVVRLGKEATDKCTKTKGSLFGPETLQNSVPKSDRVDCHRQFNSGSPTNREEHTKWKYVSCGES